VYRIGILGAGDVKLMTAIGLWAGFEYLPEFLIYVTLCGGAFTLFLLLARRLAMTLGVWLAATRTIALPRVLLNGEAVPYGVAIVAGALIMAPGLPHLGLFLWS